MILRIRKFEIRLIDHFNVELLCRQSQFGKYYEAYDITPNLGRGQFQKCIITGYVACFTYFLDICF